MRRQVSCWILNGAMALSVMIFGAVTFGVMVFGVMRSSSVMAAEIAASDLEFFEREVRPLLVTHCYECHSTTSDKLGGGLLLDHRAGWQRGGDSGTPVVAGEPDKSLLIQAVRYTDDSVQMPPAGKLPDEAIHVLEEWVRRGAADPREEVTGKSDTLAKDFEQVMQERSHWWSLEPVRVVLPPTPPSETSQDAKRPETSRMIDRYLRAALEQKQLEPAAATDPRSFARRASIVLTGLPPTEEELQGFLRDCEECRASDASGTLPIGAVERLVDRLLASPHFGERWARHWMDVVRFTETHGNEWNYEVHHAWRYRDYLIRALNDDVPYDQMIREHIAGDLLQEPRWNESEQWNESIQATAFFRFGEVNHDDCISLRELGYDILDNQIDTLTKAFQATTVACARCHDHKLDAVSMRDYYGLLGILRSSRLVAHTVDSPDRNRDRIAEMISLQREIQCNLASLWTDSLWTLSDDLMASQRKQQGAAAAEDAARQADPLDQWTKWFAVPNLPLEDLLAPWQRVASSTPETFHDTWLAVRAEYQRAWQERAEANRHFQDFGDFRGKSLPAGWQAQGWSARDAFRSLQKMHLAAEGPQLLVDLRPAGFWTSSFSDKLNGTLRSPVIPPGPKFISFQVAGQRSSAVRLVSNHCQLNYKNYRALTQPDLHWVTFPLPEDRESLRTYAELMTLLDNPKFPDQLSALGGDPENYRLPWEKAAANPRSYFGVTRVVLHDTSEPPRDDLEHLRELVMGTSEADVPESLEDLAGRYSALAQEAVVRWANGVATDADMRWLSALLRHGIFPNDMAHNATIKALSDRYRELESQLQTPRVIPGVGESGSGYDQPVFIRGNCRRPGEAAPRQFLEVLTMKGMPRMEVAEGASGRRELAEQIASPRNPLTARVYVNRIWHHLFGTGIVRSVDDFGHVGDRPSHPELLDYLAARFMEDGWSTKRLIRAIVMSHAFQASHFASPQSKQVDPTNRLLQHYPSRRMEAEAIRDAILAVSGRLDRRLFGPSVQPYREKEYADRRLFPGPLDGDGRRSIYIKNNLMEAPKFLGAFNFPGGKVAQGRRDVTNVPAQALALLNDPFVQQQADVWAGRLVQRPDPDARCRIQEIYLSALNRPPSAEELDRMEMFVRDLAELHAVSADQMLSSQPLWKDVAHAVYNLKEFIYVP